MVSPERAAVRDVMARTIPYNFGRNRIQTSSLTTTPIDTKGRERNARCIAEYGGAAGEACESKRQALNGKAF
jgi:hypothetical protein